MARVADDDRRTDNPASSPAFERLRAQLEAERRALLVSAGQAERLDSEEGTLGETEHLSVEAQRDLDAVLDAMQRAKLADLDAALARFDDGTYGRCVACGIEIPIERLEAAPAAACCVRCQASRE